MKRLISCERGCDHACYETAQDQRICARKLTQATGYQEVQMAGQTMMGQTMMGRLPLAS